MIYTDIGLEIETIDTREMAVKPEFEMNKIYIIDLTDRIKLCEIEQIVIFRDILSDGKRSSELLEWILFEELDFGDIKHIDNAKGFDYKNPYTGELYELKTFTGKSATYGMDFQQSKHKGKNRPDSTDDELYQYVTTRDFILCDVSRLPILRARTIEGCELFELYGRNRGWGKAKGKIPHKDRDFIFGGL